LRWEYDLTWCSLTCWLDFWSIDTAQMQVLPIMLVQSWFWVEILSLFQN
jgi:hypothetical protein